MSNYLRIRSRGGTYFFTVNLAARGSRGLITHIDALRMAVRDTRRERPFEIDAMVVLPDHLHSVWTLPEGDADYSTRWGAIKARFTRRVGFEPTYRPGVDTLGAEETLGAVGWKPTLRTASKLAKKDGKVWQRRFWEHTIRDEADYRAHVRYCWTNPAKHGLVARAVDWPHSSIHRDIGRGLVDPEFMKTEPVRWGSTPPMPMMGERKGAP